MNISVVCPFYNEELILDKAIQQMIVNLEALKLTWELILVNDGSEDNSLTIVQNWAAKEKRLRLVSYSVNQGRGYALKAGIDSAAGEIIVTNEIDLSWGEEIIQRLYDAINSNPKIEFVVASPHLPGGGYKNVPPKRVNISNIGNKILRIFFSFAFTMHTGMTRAYRREVIQSLKLREKGKEFHLEVLLKLTALGYKGIEIPAVIEWKDHKFSNDAEKKRKSSSRISNLIITHLRFAVLANPIRYLWGIACVNFVAGFFFFLSGIIRYILDKVAIYSLLLGLLLLVFGMVFFGFGIVTAQNRFIMEELWLSQIQKRKNNRLHHLERKVLK
jgi:glycosyltransferase involved in cell wall biosynthesis